MHHPANGLRRIPLLRTRVNKDKKREDRVLPGIIRTDYFGIGRGRKPCCGIAWEPGLCICFLFQGGKGRG
jgi:hypothetical protein